MIKLLSSSFGGCLYFPSFMQKNLATETLSVLLKTCNFENFYMPIRETLIRLPRKIDYYGEKDYSYSGVTHKAKPLTPTLLGIKNLIINNETIVNSKIIRRENLEKLNTCLLNYYEDNNSKVHYHSDDEKELGPNNKTNILIVSLSLGDSRTFSIRSKKFNNKIELNIDLNHGDLLIMYGNFQHEYEHGIIKTSEKRKERLNLTWRVIQ